MKLGRWTKPCREPGILLQRSSTKKSPCVQACEIFFRRQPASKQNFFRERKRKQLNSGIILTMLKKFPLFLHTEPWQYSEDLWKDSCVWKFLLPKKTHWHFWKINSSKVRVNP